MKIPTVTCIILLGGLLAACGTGSGAPSAVPLVPQSPQEVVATAYVTYTTAGKLALNYTGLPRCAPAAPPLCSDQAVVDHIKEYSQRTLDTIKGAEVIVRKPGVGTGVVAAIAVGAQIAADGLQKFTAGLPAK